jgi:hypothetical protein
MLDALLDVLTSEDYRFINTLGNAQGPVERASTTLAQAIPGLPELVAADWPQLRAWLEELSTPRAAPGTLVEWEAVARSSEHRFVDNPPTFTIVMLSATAGWESLLGNVYEEGPEGPSRGWRNLVLPLARCLIATDALWGPRQLLVWVSEVAERAKAFAYDEEMLSLSRDARALLGEVDRHLDKEIGRLADDLSSHCTPGSTARNHLAAMMWTVGDVPAARMLLRTSKGLPKRAIHEFVDGSVRFISTDAFLQQLWLTIPEHTSLDLSAHEHLAPRLTNSYHTTVVHWLWSAPGFVDT